VGTVRAWIRSGFLLLAFSLGLVVAMTVVVFGGFVPASDR